MLTGIESEEGVLKVICLPACDVDSVNALRTNQLVIIFKD
jgi:hypothetical protein